MPPPDHRARRILGAAHDHADCPSDDPLERDLFHLVKNDTCASPDVRTAADLYADPEYRHIIDALLLAKAEAGAVEASLWLPATAYQTYGYLFFDTTSFGHALAATRYVQRLEVPPTVRELYQLALDRGPTTILDRYRIGERPRLDPERVMYEVLGDAYAKFLTHRGLAANHEVAKEALRWGHTAMRAAEALGDAARDASRATNAWDDLRIALRVTDLTKKPSDLDIDVTDLVTG